MSRFDNLGRISETKISFKKTNNKYTYTNIQPHYVALGWERVLSPETLHLADVIQWGKEF